MLPPPAGVAGYSAPSYQHLSQSTCEVLQLVTKYCSLPVRICGEAHCPGGVASG
ncbi:unnamed protein product [Ectocarpus sp. 6 AP-2014]